MEWKYLAILLRLTMKVIIGDVALIPISIDGGEGFYLADDREAVTLILREGWRP